MRPGERPTLAELLRGKRTDEIAAMGKGLPKAIHYLVAALYERGEQEKQWHIEQALTALDVDLAPFSHLRGVAP